MGTFCTAPAFCRGSRAVLPGIACQSSCPGTNACCSCTCHGLGRYAVRIVKGKVFVVGTGMPNECRNLLKSGDLDTITLWDPADAGYAMCNLAMQVLDGEEIREDTDLGLTSYESLKVSADDDNLLMGDASIAITAENVDDYNF